MQNFRIFLFSFSLTAILWGVLLFFLEKTPIFFVENKKNYSFYSINLTPLFFNNKQKTTIKQTYSLKGIKLKGLYYNGKTGFIIIEEKNKNIFVDLNSEYKGYKLVEIKNTYAVFTKNGKFYRINIDKMKFDKLIKNIKTPQAIKIPKKIINNYKNNFSNIWKNISIGKTKKGYLITYVNKKSIFYDIGLRKGDVILEVNGIKLKKDADAWYVYKHINSYNSVELTILRNNQKKVLYYEMD